MYMNAYKVMNNNDLRKMIFDFLPLHYCHECKQPTIEKQYIKFNNWTCCFSCFRNNYSMMTEQIRSYHYRKALKELR